MKINILLLDTIAEEGIQILRRFANVTDGREMSQDAVLDCIERFDGLLIKSGNHIGAQYFARARKLKLIGRAGSGLDNIDMDAARKHGVTVITSPEGNVVAVAEHVISMAILLGHQLHQAHLGAMQNDFRRANWQGRNLANLQVGIIGAGHIGRAVIKKIAPLCRQVLAYDPYVSDWSTQRQAGVKVMDSLHALLAESDVVSLHLPLTAQSRHLLDAAAFASMRRGTILINTARGEVIDDAALLNALEDGTVEAAALDALHPDPKFNQSPWQSRYSHFLVHHPKVYYTPHIAAGTRDALHDVACNLARRMQDFFAENYADTALAQGISN